MHDNYYDLAKRIADIFPEMESDIIVDMGTNNKEYTDLRNQLTDMQKTYPFIPAIIEGVAAVSISAEEHKILSEYFKLQVKIENMERLQIYFRGHTDNFAYLKKINAI